MTPDPRQQAEDFIDRVIVPLRAAESRFSREAPASGVDEERALLGAAMAESGFDMSRVDEAARERLAARQASAAKARREADAAAEEFGRRLAELPPFVPPLDPTDTVIDQVTFIRSFAGQGAVLDSQVAPYDNWAKFRLESEESAWSGSGRLSFFTLWQNPLDENALLAPEAHVAVNGRAYCEAGFSGTAAWFGMESVASVEVGVRTTIWGMSSDQRSVVAELDLASLEVDGGFWGDDGATSIHLNDVVAGAGAIVAPRAFALIEVELFADWKANSGAKVVVDLEQGSRRMFVSQIVLPGIADPRPQPSNIVLSVTTRQVQNVTLAELSWTGASGANVTVLRNGANVGTTANDGSYQVPVSAGTHEFRVCEEGSNLCSNAVTVTV